MDDIEKYAVELVADGAEGSAEDDVERARRFANETNRLTAAGLGVKMAQAIKDNPDAFLAWYRSIAPAELGR